MREGRYNAGQGYRKKTRWPRPMIISAAGSVKVLTQNHVSMPFLAPPSRKAVRISRAQGHRRFSGSLGRLSVEFLRASVWFTILQIAVCR